MKCCDWSSDVCSSDLFGSIGVSMSAWHECSDSPSWANPSSPAVTASTLFAALGEDTDMWIGKEVILVVQEVTFGNKTVPSIRIKNLNSRDALIQAYWSKTRELGMTNPEGLAHLKQSSGDFQSALDALVNPF